MNIIDLDYDEILREERIKRALISKIELKGESYQEEYAAGKRLLGSIFPIIGVSFVKMMEWVLIYTLTVKYLLNT